MSLPWSKLYEVRDYVPIADLGVSLEQPIIGLSLIGESPQSISRFVLRGWFKIGPNQYIRSNLDAFHGFEWAVSDGAFAYILTNDLYFDDGLTSPPPVDLLPDKQAFDWKSVVTLGRQSGDRCFLDIDFYNRREVRFGRYKFYYRNTFPETGEAPICIRIDPKNFKLADESLGLFRVRNRLH